VLNRERIHRDVVVIGASAGGVEALITLLEKLPADTPAAIAVVLHRSPVHATALSSVLGRRAALPVYEPAGGDAFKPGAIWVAPRDQHLLLDDDGDLRLSRGPREHHTRPAIDPLFVSAAKTYASRVVGVVLSGTGDDGVRGLIAIKAAGGLSLVQNPDEARHAAMPLNALARDRVNAALALNDLALVLPALAAGEAVGLDPTAAVPKS
jgi:two-component system, chemotaxis family, protein-glutamate methylesterase/glutaminase